MDVGFAAPHSIFSASQEMISKDTLRALRLFLRYGNFIHIFPFEWSGKLRGIRTLRYKRWKWEASRIFLTFHILIRLFNILIFIGAILFGDCCGVNEILLALFFISIYILTLSFLCECLFRSGNVIGTFNETLRLHDRMGKSQNQDQELEANYDSLLIHIMMYIPYLTLQLNVFERSWKLMERLGRTGWSL